MSFYVEIGPTIDEAFTGTKGSSWAQQTQLNFSSYKFTPQDGFLSRGLEGPTTGCTDLRPINCVTKSGVRTARYSDQLAA